MTKALTTGFDYSAVEKEAKGKLIVLAGQVKRGKANYAKSVLELGCAVHEAHELLAGTGRDGKFKQWVEAECGLEQRTAYNYLYAFEAFNKIETVSSFSAGAMYALSAPACPVKARKEAIKRAEKGERISKVIADDIIESFTVEPEEVSNVGHLSDSASVTGTAAKSNGAPPDLPSVGTVNRTESGSQDSGDAGECPRGGSHDRGDDGTCTKCKDPPPIIPMEGGDSFDPANIEAHAESFAANFSAKVKAHNLAIDRYCQRIKAAFDNDVPASPWFDDSRKGIVGDQISSAIGSARQAKVHDKPCPKCDGKGSHTGKPCKTCRGYGMLPKTSYEMAGGQ